MVMSSWRGWHRLHRRTGLVTAVLVVVLALTGLLLAYQEELGLNGVEIRSGWLVSWYGRDRLPDEALAFDVADGILIWADGQVYAGEGAPLVLARPVGAVVSGDYLFVSTGDAALVLSKQGLLIERLDAAGLPGPVRRVGRSAAGGAIVDTGKGRYQADGAFLSWSSYAGSADTVRWSMPSLLSALPGDARQGFLERYQGQGVSVARLLLDAHTGKLFGAVGGWVMQGAALGLLFLAATGWINWWRRRRS